MTMNLDRHVDAHRELFMHMVRGDGDSAAKHKEFYDEYMAVMDLTAEFYLQTVETVFIKHALPTGTMTHRGIPVDPSKIRNVALMTVEGEKDDITGGGQTEAAHRLASELAGRQAPALRPAGRRPLRRVQRLALPQGDRAAHRRLHAGERTTERGSAAQVGRETRRSRTSRSRTNRLRSSSSRPSAPRASTSGPAQSRTAAQPRPGRSGPFSAPRAARPTT